MNNRSKPDIMYELMIEILSEEELEEFNHLYTSFFELLGDYSSLMDEKKWNLFLEKLDEINSDNNLLALKVVTVILYKKDAHYEDEVINALLKRFKSYFANDNIDRKERIEFAVKYHSSRPKEYISQFSDYEFTKPLEVLFINEGEENPAYVLEQFNKIDKPNRDYFFKSLDHSPENFLKFGEIIKEYNSSLYMTTLVNFLYYYNPNKIEFKNKVLDTDKIREVSTELYRMIEDEQYDKAFNLENTLRNMIRYCYMDEVWYPRLFERLWNIELGKSETDLHSIKNYLLIGINCLDNQKLVDEVYDKFYIWGQEYKQFDSNVFSTLNPKSFGRRINKMKSLINNDFFDLKNIHFHSKLHSSNIENKINQDLTALFGEILAWAKDKNRILYFKILVSYFNIDFESKQSVAPFQKAEEQFMTEFKSCLKKDTNEAAIMLGLLLNISDAGWYPKKHINQMVDKLFFMLYDIDKEKAQNELKKIYQKVKEFYEKYDRGGPAPWNPRYSASTEYASNELLKKLSNYDDEKVREAVAENPKTQDDVLLALSQDESEEVRAKVALNHNTPSEILDKLSRDKSNRVSEVVARNPNTDPLLLERLSRYEQWVRVNLSWNPNLPMNLIEKLSRDRDAFVRSCIASHKRTSVEILRELSKDKEVSVRASVASNKNTPSEILEVLSSDDGGLKLIISSFFSSLKYRIKKLTSNDIYLIISRERFKDDINKRYKYEVRENVASNPNTPKYVLEKLLNDKEEIVARSAKYALNPSSLGVR